MNFLKYEDLVVQLNSINFTCPVIKEIGMAYSCCFTSKKDAVVTMDLVYQSLDSRRKFYKEIYENHLLNYNEELEVVEEAMKRLPEEFPKFSVIDESGNNIHSVLVSESGRNKSVVEPLNMLGATSCMANLGMSNDAIVAALAMWSVIANDHDIPSIHITAEKYETYLKAFINDVSIKRTEVK